METCDTSEKNIATYHWELCYKSKNKNYVIRHNRSGGYGSPGVLSCPMTLCWWQFENYTVALTFSVFVSLLGVLGGGKRIKQFQRRNKRDILDL